MDKGVQDVEDGALGRGGHGGFEGLKGDTATVVGQRLEQTLSLRRIRGPAATLCRPLLRCHVTEPRRE